MGDGVVFVAEPANVVRSGIVCACRPDGADCNGLKLVSAPVLLERAMSARIEEWLLA